VGVQRGWVFNDTQIGEIEGLDVFGWWNVSAHGFNVPGGKKWVQGCMEVYVTAESE
jgi:hypothetical protein